ncbi:hypothetical protein APSETT444_003483 [Aspergillus pseudonomiae]
MLLISILAIFSFLCSAPVSASRVIKSNSLDLCTDNKNFTATFFNVTFTPDTRLLSVGFNGTVAISGNVVADLSLTAYGKEVITKTLDPCQMKEQRLCPMNIGKLEIPAIQTTLPQSVINDVPNIAYTVPDLDASVRVYINSTDTGAPIACMEASLSNSKSVHQQAVGWANIERTDIFMTGFIFIMVFIGFAMLIVGLVRLVSGLLAKSGKTDSTKMDSNTWAVTMKGILLRLILMCYPAVILGVILFVYNAILTLILIIVILIASIMALVSKNPDNKYQVMKDDGSSIMSRTHMTELDALGAAARGSSDQNRKQNPFAHNEVPPNHANGLQPSDRTSPSHMTGANHSPSSPLDPSVPLFPSSYTRSASPYESGDYNLSPSEYSQPGVSPVNRGYNVSPIHTPSPHAYRAGNNATPWQRGAGYDH